MTGMMTIATKAMINHETVFSMYIVHIMDLLTGNSTPSGTNLAKISAVGQNVFNVTYFVQYIFDNRLDNLSSACQSARAFLRCPKVVEHILRGRWFFIAPIKRVM